MADDRFDGLARALQPLSGRRQTLRIAAASLLAIGLGLTPGVSDARKKGKKKKKKKPPTCAAQCPSCPICYAPAQGPAICGGGGSAVCAMTCSSHSDCVGTDFPYCTRTFTQAGPGKTFPVCSGSGACTKIPAC